MSALAMMLALAIATPAMAEAQESWRTYLDYQVAKVEMLAEDITVQDILDYTPPVPVARESRIPVRAAPVPVTVATTPTSSGVEQWRSLVETAFPPERVEEALRVMDCESHGNPNAKNRNSSASGLFQHLTAFMENNAWRIGLEWYDRFDPVLNIRVTALVVANDGGWRQWSCKP